jgi:hypothetical protein
MGGGDERAGAKRRYPFALDLTNAIERREPRRVGGVNWAYSITCRQPELMDAN